MKTHLYVPLLAAAFVFLPAIYAQDSIPKAQQQEDSEMVAGKALEADLGTRKKNLLTYSEDLESMMKSLRGVDVENALAIDQRAGQGVMYLDATVWFVGIYNRMQCEQDRNLVRVVLQNRWGFYSHMLDMSVDQTNGYIGLSRVPAIVQQGRQIRDELRAAKNKLDEIMASLK